MLDAVYAGVAQPLVQLADRIGRRLDQVERDEVVNSMIIEN